MLAADLARSPVNNEVKLDAFLKSWWSRTYSRPMKDPILASYTTEELLFEYYDKIERAKAELERHEQEGDKIESGKIADTLDWAEKEELADLEKMKAAQANGGFTPDYVDPMKDPANKEWVDKQLAEAKRIHGEDFGEDIDTDFGDIDGS